MQQKIVWILVADARNARIIERIDSAGGLLEIHTLTSSHEFPFEHESGKTKQETQSSNMSNPPHKPYTDRSEQQKDKFSKEIVTLLDEAHKNKKFDELHLLAPTKIIERIRHHIINTNHHIGPKVSKELTKDAISFNLDELEKAY